MISKQAVDFNNPLIKRLIELKLKVPNGALKYFVMPLVGDTITLGNIIYKISYVRENPFRFTAEPVAILQDKDMQKLNPELLQNSSAKIE